MLGGAPFLRIRASDSDTDMVATIRPLLTEEALRKAEGVPTGKIPMRPDTGHRCFLTSTRR